MQRSLLRKAYWQAVGTSSRRQRWSLRGGRANSVHQGLHVRRRSTKFVNRGAELTASAKLSHFSAQPSITVAHSPVCLVSCGFPSRKKSERTRRRKPILTFPDDFYVTHSTQATSIKNVPSPVSDLRRWITHVSSQVFGSLVSRWPIRQPPRSSPMFRRISVTFSSVVSRSPPSRRATIALWIRSDILSTSLCYLDFVSPSSLDRNWVSIRLLLFFAGRTLITN